MSPIKKKAHTSKKSHGGAAKRASNAASKVAPKAMKPAPSSATKRVVSTVTKGAGSRPMIVSDADVQLFPTKKAWQTWLETHHGRSTGVWLHMAKTGSGTTTVTYTEALEVALCYGWIDGTRKGRDATSYLQRFSPRGSRSIWSKINCEKADALIASGAMKPAGLAAVEQAKRNGQWAAAYAGPRTAVVPEDLQAALDGNAKAAAFFATLSGRNRYAILFRLHHAKKAETRARRLEQFVHMLEKHETIYPQ